MRTPATAPVADIDPFCAEFFEDPFPAHEALREAGPAMHLSRCGVWGIARYQHVHAILARSLLTRGLAGLPLRLQPA